MASDFHVPCFIICSRGTPWLNAQEAPALLKAWKVKEGESCRAKEAFLKCFLATESVSGMHLLFLHSMNNGSLFKAGIMWAICRMAAMGQRGDWPKLGRGIVTVDFLS